MQPANLSASGQYPEKLLTVQMHVRTLSFAVAFPCHRISTPHYQSAPHLPRLSLTHSDGRFTTSRQLPKLAQRHFAISVGENSVEGSSLRCGARQDIGVCRLPCFGGVEVVLLGNDAMQAGRICTGKLDVYVGAQAAGFG
ncbi:hypothetical protein HBI56_102860 [Parastagonospora nodorum]|uniref:Uncharacterized protein n=2 Tax=Phaeosphaeria nodorum (strain SN15 / ATCC MYA-4574 / FGSC 10173) TaxID=321614 RepID=A0A7U2FC42_PHANO|nr:hypothetical protein SNOG_20118 [Parastagonospora nodorum SN15]KAH3911528.1 hypothetical protein HBH56_136000 [Parastagonospora nodorum]EDP89804.1 hypothetical protein SNOG_20118 [Parastagonospora nodorum SN15]KAH3926986.1 hypothetical protein HBH54_157290 [Parastagonospora nodorum]KAH3974621.1 hypothetical protein HBH52_130620 [Parastagonospora nodorum]KAH3991380.1 hypothetical protein HBI10_232950 [Parastagonospora nodorum]